MARNFTEWIILSNFAPLYAMGTTRAETIVQKQRQNNIKK